MNQRQVRSSQGEPGYGSDGAASDRHPQSSSAQRRATQATTVLAVVSLCVLLVCFAVVQANGSFSDSGASEDNFRVAQHGLLISFPTAIIAAGARLLIAATRVRAGLLVASAAYAVAGVATVVVGTSSHRFDLTWVIPILIGAAFASISVVILRAALLVPR